MNRLPVIGTKYTLFKHGHVMLLDVMPSHINQNDPLGAERKILDAARTSTNLDTITKKFSSSEPIKYDYDRDAKLIQYLMKHDHGSPFDQIQIQLHLRLPMFVFGHLIRYRTASFNVESGRYAKYKKEFYVPEKDRLLKQSKINKQASSDEIIDAEGIELFNSNLDLANASYENFELLVDKYGLSREMARITNSQNLFVSCVMSINLRNILNIIKQRTHPTAQYETRMYAFAMYNLVEKIAPITLKTFMDTKVFKIDVNPEDLILENDKYVIRCDLVKEGINEVNNLKADFKLYTSQLIDETINQ